MDKFIGKAREIITKCSKAIKASVNIIGSSVMSKDEALKILNIKESNATVDKIISQSNEYIQANDPLKGGSFYIQNKVFHARETLLRLYKNDKANGYWNRKKTSNTKLNDILSSKAQEEVNKLNKKH